MGEAIEKTPIHYDKQIPPPLEEKFTTPENGTNGSKEGNSDNSGSGVSSPSQLAPICKSHRRSSCTGNTRIDTKNGNFLVEEFKLFADDWLIAGSGVSYKKEIFVFFRLYHTKYALQETLSDAILEEQLIRWNKENCNADTTVYPGMLIGLEINRKDAYEVLNKQAMERAARAAAAEEEEDGDIDENDVNLDVSLGPVNKGTDLDTTSTTSESTPESNYNFNDAELTNESPANIIPSDHTAADEKIQIDKLKRGFVDIASKETKLACESDDKNPAIKLDVESPNPKKKIKKKMKKPESNKNCTPKKKKSIKTTTKKENRKEDSAKISNELKITTTGEKKPTTKKKKKTSVHSSSVSTNTKETKKKEQIPEPIKKKKKKKKEGETNENITKTTVCTTTEKATKGSVKIKKKKKKPSKLQQ